MKGRSLVSAADLSCAEVEQLLESAQALKREPRGFQPLARRVLAMIFEKPSLRTRVSFETGMVQLGGHAIYLAPADIQLGRREAVADVARNLSRMCDGIMARTFAHATVAELAEHATVPVINGLCDLEHPCQGLADVLTIHEVKGLDRRPTVAYIGDGNNVCHSLMILAETLGLPMRVGCPAGYEPLLAIRERCPGTVVVNNAREAADGADVVYTDVWASMGQEDEIEERNGIFAAYQVDEEMMARAGKGALFLHCLPAHRGAEVTAAVMDGPHSIVFDNAENRLHVQKAILALLLNDPRYQRKTKD
ncbi:MAG: ornithine carbamoyltransferase [Armatimonadetes bacterium]|nr:ornithine carbamoyltransferase [Armatimonadota bacterium]